jgi:hypothetical protein
METLLGFGNGIEQYFIVLCMYAALFVIMRYAHPVVELNFRTTFLVLWVGWGVGVFIGNYLCYLLGIMSFLPWVNNALHTFVWIGLCLGFLYAGCHNQPMLEQFALFFIFSLFVKVTEREVLGTWEFDHFFFVHGNIAYLLGWSLLDGLYPFISIAVLKVASRFVDGVVIPS